MQRAGASAGPYTAEIGEGEIRTPDTFYSMLAFQASAFDHSATSPRPAPLFHACGGEGLAADLRMRTRTVRDCI
jgi:hypothetical protein